MTKLSLMLGESLNVSFGEALKAVRSDRGLSARGLSEQCDLSPAYISKVENGTSVPSARVFSRILKELDCNLVEIAFLVGILMREEKLTRESNESKS